MAVSLVQSATAATGGTKASSLTATLGGAPTNGNTLLLCILYDNQPDGTGNVSVSTVTAGLVLRESQVSSTLRMAVYRLTGTIAALQAATVTFSAVTYASLFYVEVNGANSLLFTDAGFSGAGTISAVGNLPTSQGQLVGDLPLGFFGVRDAATVTPQGGWTELVNLNGSAGQFAQLEVQQGPLTVSAPQAVTASAGVAVLSGTDLHSIAMLVVASALDPLALLSQENVEVVAVDTANALLSQEYVEAVSADSAFARCSQVYVEAVIPLYARFSQEEVEVIGTDTARARVSQVVVEVLWSSEGARRRTVEDEMLTY